MKKYLKPLFAVVVGIIMTANVNAQCIATSQFGSANLNGICTGATVTISTCIFAGEFSPVSGLIIGNSYMINATGGVAYATITTVGNMVLAYGPTPLTWEATEANVRVHWHTNADCGTAFSCSTTTITCLSDGPTPSIPLKNWSIIFGFILIIGYIAFRFRTRFAHTHQAK